MPSDNEQRTALRCKPGDRAIISRCGNDSYIGLVVRIVAPHETPDFDWLVKFLGEPVSGHELYTRKPGIFTHAPVYDWNLTPLPDAVNECLYSEAAPHLVGVRTLEEFPPSN